MRSRLLAYRDAVGGSGSLDVSQCPNKSTRASDSQMWSWLTLPPLPFLRSRLIVPQAPALTHAHTCEHLNVVAQALLPRWMCQFYVSWCLLGDLLGVGGGFLRCLPRFNPAGLAEITPGVYLPLKPEPGSQVTTLLRSGAGSPACCISPDVAAREMAQRRAGPHGLAPEEAALRRRQ